MDRPEAISKMLAETSLGLASVLEQDPEWSYDRASAPEFEICKYRLYFNPLKGAIECAHCSLGIAIAGCGNGIKLNQRFGARKGTQSAYVQLSK
jgi:hypothetical protein